MPKSILSACLSSLLCATAMTAHARDANRVDLTGLDPQGLMAQTQDVVMRAPDDAIDGLFQAALKVSQSEEEAPILCKLFDPHADRSVESLVRTANGFGDASRERFAMAIAEIALSGAQNGRQPYDPMAARQTLKQAGVTAMLLNDGFLIGMTATENDRASREARCQSMRWLFDALKDQPLAQRAAATRLLLSDGMAQVGL